MVGLVHLTCIDEYMVERSCKLFLWLTHANGLTSTSICHFSTQANRAIGKLTFSSSFSEAGDTSECRRSSGERGGARPWLAGWAPELAEPILTSEWRRCRASSTGTSRRESVEFWEITGWARDWSFRRQMLHRHVFCGQRNQNVEVEMVNFEF